MSKANENYIDPSVSTNPDNYKHSKELVQVHNKHPRLFSQLSIQPNIPTHMMLGRSDSRRLVSQKSTPTFPTKTLRMKSLLWTKPTGVAISSMSSTVKQVSEVA